MVNVKVNNFTTKALVDSGSDISALSNDFFQKIKSTNHHLSRSNIFQIKGAGGHVQGVFGKIVLSLHIADNDIQHTFHVIPNLNQKCILGHDFLTKYEATINYATNTLSFQYHNNVTHIDFLSIQSPMQARIEEPIFIPANSLAFFTVKIHNCPPDTNILLFPRSFLTRLNLTLHHSIVSPINNIAQIAF